MTDKPLKKMNTSEMSDWIRGHMQKSKFHDGILLIMAGVVAITSGMPLMLSGGFFVVIGGLLYLANR